jgi:hypothetical protein
MHFNKAVQLEVEIKVEVELKCHLKRREDIE